MCAPRFYLRLAVCLVVEECPLLDGVVQLCVAVAQLLLVHKQLKSLRHSRHVTVPAVEERGNGVVSTEGKLVTAGIPATHRKTRESHESASSR